MASKNFQGTSTRGDVNEAIDLATAAAKNGLKTDRVLFTVKSTTGDFGGFIDATSITVAITARKGSVAARKKK